ncbi:hypothetical protein LAT59_02475 [Candidatus Gracilibacteria bacterium]|nr:hypothetical protein [Candidatus Gracilibacteria bacterium]
MSKIITFPSHGEVPTETRAETITPPNFMVIIMADKDLASSLRVLQVIINNSGENFEGDFKQFLAFREKKSPEIQRKLLKHIYSVLLYLGKISPASSTGEIEAETESFLVNFSASGILQFPDKKET